MTGELWWSRLVNSARFLDDIKDKLADNKSVLLLFNKEIPWRDIMINTLEQKLSYVNSEDRTFDVHYVSNDAFSKQNHQKLSPGEYFMERYCEEEQNEYWPTTHGSREKFMAQSKKTLLNSRYVIFTDINAEDAAKWTASVTEYLENCEDTERHGLFIIILEGVNVPTSKYLTTFKYDDYVTDYDCMMLCMTLVSDIKCSRAEKMYLCEVASNIAHNDAGLSALLASRKTELIHNPYSVTAEVFEKNNVTVNDLKEHVRMAVWEAQIKLVFPKIENFRANLIKKYENKFSYYLPINSSNNDVIDKATDLEIGQLYFICKENSSKKIVDPTEYEMLKKMRNARNTLAHWESLSYEELTEIKVI